ncbi:RAPSN (predicted) [Pycnogonum litorale]
MGQRIAKTQVEKGLQLYSENKHEDAVRKWKHALRRISKQSDRGLTLGYLCRAHYDWGKYRNAIEYANQQLEVANAIDSNTMRAHAYLNLANGHQRLSDYTKAVSCCRHALYNITEQTVGKTIGQVYVCLGLAYIGLSNFTRSVEFLENGLKVARDTKDSNIQLECFIVLGILFTVLKDYDKALKFLLKAFHASKSFKICDFNSKYQRHVLLHLATALRKVGRLCEAVQHCEDALRMAIDSGDRPTQAYCLCCQGDIFRQKNDLERAYPRYEAAFSIMIETDEKLGQCIVLSNMAKTLFLMKKVKKACACKALEYNARALDIATNVGNKLLMRSCHVRMAEIYRMTDDLDNQRHHALLCASLVAEMGLKCGVCYQDYGLSPGKVEALPCSHIFHTRCVKDVIRRQPTILKKKRNCPECRKTLTSRQNWVSNSYEELSPEK